VPAACQPSQPSPGSIEPGSFSLAEVPPQSSFVSSSATRLSPSRSPTEVSALIAASPSASTPAGDSIHLLRSVLRLSQPLDGLLRVSASQVCFAPQATSRVHARSGVSRSTQPSPVSRFRAPMPLAASRSRPRRNAATSGWPRLRGFDPCEVACVRSGVTRAERRSPHRVALLRVSASRTPGGGYPSPSAHDLCFVVAFGCPLASTTGLQRLVRPELVVDSSPLRRDPLEVSTLFQSKL
jgi:hypothetical protein